MTIRKITFATIILFSSALLIGQPLSVQSTERNEEVPTSKYESTCDRELIVNEYEAIYLATSVSTMELAWTGDVDECQEGEISALAMNRTRDRINYFRKLVGLNNEIHFSEEKNAKCQKAVLMMDAENMLDHNPTMDWMCASADGIQAAGKSNISYGGHSSASVPQYIRDAGTYNGPVGHRRWILYPKAHEFGFGSTDWGTAMWVIGGNQNPEVYPEYVAYPSPGYFPKPLVYPRWSFSKKGANFQESHISMQDENGNLVDLMVEEVVNGYGDNTIVWQPEINLYDNEGGADHYYEVSIDSVKVGGEYLSFNYEVLAIDMNVNEPVITSISPSCNGELGSISLEITTGHRSLEWSNGAMDQTTIGNLEAGSYSVTITDKLGCASVMNVSLEQEGKAVELGAIMGSTSSTHGATNKYSIGTHEDGSYEWTIEGGTVSGEANASEVAVEWGSDTSTGKVCVKFTGAEGCESNEVCQDVELAVSSTLGIMAAEILISPNPVSSLVSIESDDFISNLTLTHINGSTLLRMKCADTKSEMIDMSKYASGIYFLGVRTNDGFTVRKLVKE